MTLESERRKARVSAKTAPGAAQPTTRKKSVVREIGWREIVGLPDLGIESIKAKVDTGARTSAIHAEIVREYDKDGVAWIDFRVPQSRRKSDGLISLPLIDRRHVKNTSGVPEERHVVRTTLVLGNRHWLIELTLTDRENMTFDIILGRTAIRDHGLCVHPGRSFLAGPPQIK